MRLSLIAERASLTDPFGEPVNFSDNLPKRWRLITVDADRLDAAWSRSSNYVGGEESPAAIDGRIPGFARWYQANKGAQDVKPPRVYFMDGQVQFDDGRHRWAWMRSQGFRHIPIYVPYQQVKRFAEFTV
jgi:hypothetical protein